MPTTGLELDATVYAGSHTSHLRRGTEHDDERTPVTHPRQQAGANGLRALPGELKAP
jgi:hypothetical protein